MRPALVIFSLAAFALLLATGLNTAGEKGDKEVVLKGSITCNKCDLGKSAECETIIVVKEKDKDIVYHFDKKSDKKYHDDICTGAKKGTVTGTVKDEGKKKVVTVKKLEYAK